MGFCAIGDGSGTVFSDINLTEKVCYTNSVALEHALHVHASHPTIQEWTEYDENARQPVSILEVEHRFIKL